MSDVYEAKEEMHSIEAQLYHNYLHGGEGTFIARNTKEKTIDIEAVCAAMKNRGGYDGGVDEAVKTVKHFLKEAMYQLCDGFSVNLGWFTINVSFVGVFHSVTEPFTKPKHKVTFKFHMLKAMRKLTDSIEVKVNGHIEDPAYIDEFIDLEEEASNSIIVPGHGFAIHGHNIKIEGTHPDIGVYFHADGNPNQTVKIDRILENTPSKIVGIAESLPVKTCRVAVITQYSGGVPLKDIRIIRSPFVIEEA